MKYLIFPLVALGLGTAAMAQPPAAPKSYPPCSKSVTDECMGSSGTAMHHAMHHGAMRPAHHRKMAAHHRPHHMAHAAHHAMKPKPEHKPS